MYLSLFVIPATSECGTFVVIHRYDDYVADVLQLMSLRLPRHPDTPIFLLVQLYHEL